MSRHTEQSAYKRKKESQIAQEEEAVMISTRLTSLDIEHPIHSAR